jgi:hypothetical protein
MARPSKLTPEQWADIDRRLIAGEVPSDLAREFKVHPAQISRRTVSQNVQSVRAVAQRIAESQDALAALPRTAQYQALNLAEKLRSISGNLASAAELGAKTAHRLQALANGEVQKVDDEDPMSSLDNLRGVGVMTKLANDSASIALNLLAANKDVVQRIPDEEEPLTALDMARRAAFLFAQVEAEGSTIQ